MVINLKDGWSVIEDVHFFGDLFGAYRKTFDPRRFGGDPSIEPMAPWEEIPRLEHLQLTYAQNPYYGRDLRQMNDSPWWYKNEFTVEEDTPYALLTFHGVDYFADVWLNEEYLGAHEGYNTPFSFEVGKLLKKGEKNLLVVKVCAPWENEILPNFEYIRFCTVIRDQMKGTYEHSDTFLPRDVNPIGIWDKVELTLYNGVRLSDDLRIAPKLSGDYGKADVVLSGTVVNHTGRKLTYQATVTEFGSNRTVCTEEGDCGEQLSAILTVMKPKLWTVWERGDANRYTLKLKLFAGEENVLSEEKHFGIRDIRLIRNEKEMYVLLNGEKIYIRGTTYFPDVYLSALCKERYIHDLDNARAAGMNSLRIHVHAEKDEFYDLCDERGILLVQDSDFNWVHPATKEWGKRAIKMFDEMLLRLRNHPSIFCWVLLNEPRGENFLKESPGPQMKESVARLDPDRPYILSSWERNDPESGDSHNYCGSLDGHHTHYTDIYGTSEKFNTEFGMDAPPCFHSMRKEKRLCEILGKSVLDGIDSIQYYQYRYLKYFIEHYRTQKYAPCGGHYQFLFSDPAPTSFFGVYDFCGLPKQAKRAFEESNQPIAFLMETKKTAPVALYAVNDLLTEYPDTRAIWEIVCGEETVLQGDKIFDLQKDSIVKILDLTGFVPDEAKDYTVHLKLLSKDGGLLAENLYESAFCPPEHTKGHPDYVHHGIGLRTYWAWMS